MDFMTEKLTAITTELVMMKQSFYQRLRTRTNRKQSWLLSNSRSINCGGMINELQSPD